MNKYIKKRLRQSNYELYATIRISLGSSRRNLKGLRKLFTICVIFSQEINSIDAPKFKKSPHEYRKKSKNNNNS